MGITALPLAPLYAPAALTPAATTAPLLHSKGEIRAGSWGWAPAHLSDVLPPPVAPTHLWQALLTSGRLAWMRS